MSSLKLLVLAICCIALIFGEEESVKTETKSEKAKPKATKTTSTDSPKSETKTKNNAPNYDAVIETMQGRIDKMDISTSKSDAEIASAKAELTKIKKKLDDVEVKASDINTVQQFLNTLTDSVATLSARIEKMESDQTKLKEQQEQQAQKQQSQSNDEGTCSTEEVDAKMEAMSENIAREIDDNSQRLDILSEIMDEKADFVDINAAIEELSESVSTSARRIDGILENQWEAKILRNVTKRIEKIEAAIHQHTKDIKSVYSSTLIAKLDVFLVRGLEFLNIVGKYCKDYSQWALNELQSIDYKAYFELFKAKSIEYSQKAVAEFQKIDWKGYADKTVAKCKDIFETLSDAKQYEKIVDLFKSVYDYVKFWTQEAIQPAIIRQATNLYVGGRRFVAKSIDYVHSHILYLELTKQSKVYIKMANIPIEYASYIIDGALVLFSFSSLMTVWIILGLFCDCCCPRIPQKKKISESNGIVNKPITVNNKGKKRRASNKT